MGFFEKIKNGLTKTRDQFKTKIEWMVAGKPIEEDAFDEIEEALILADAGLETTELLVDALKDKWKRGSIRTTEDIRTSMKEEVEKLLTPIEAPLTANGTKPFVILALGVNGVGKTTTIAKMAGIYLKDGRRVLLGACDTFRAAAIEQLDVWAKTAQRGNGTACRRFRPGGGRLRRGQGGQVPCRGHRILDTPAGSTPRQT